MAGTQFHLTSFSGQEKIPDACSTHGGVSLLVEHERGVQDEVDLDSGRDHRVLRDEADLPHQLHRVQDVHRPRSHLRRAAHRLSGKKQRMSDWRGQSPQDNRKAPDGRHCYAESSRNSTNQILRGKLPTMWHLNKTRSGTLQKQQTLAGTHNI